MSMDGSIDRWLGGRTVQQADRRTDGQTGGGTDGRDGE